jgi:hypothetical protein
MLGPAITFVKHVPHILSSLAIHDTPIDTVEGLRDHDPHFGLSPSVFALVFGIVSGLSLPLGAAAGIYLSPVRPHTCAMMMAFGAGALLFAVTVELYGHALNEVKEGHLGVLEMFVIIFGALAGAAFYLTSNQWLKEHFEAEEVEEDAEAPVEHAVSSAMIATKSMEEKDPLLKAAQDARREAERQRARAVSEIKEHEREESLRAPMLAALKHSEEEEKSPRTPRMAKTETGTPEKAKSAKDMWAKLRGEKRTVLKLITPKKVVSNKAYERPREQAIKALAEAAPPAEGADGEVDIANNKGLAAAAGIFLGLLVDGLPEGILMGFLSAEGHLTPVLIASLFVANLPESFASGSLMVQSQALSTATIMALWTGLCLLVGSLCGLSCYLLLYFFPNYGVYSSHGGHGGQLPMSVLIGIALVEGITGGAMIACISSVMLPEAFAQGDKNRPFLHQTGFMCTAGFLVSVALKTLFG